MPDNELENKHVTISLKTVGSVASAAVAVLGAIWALDNHYASAADVEKIQRSMEFHVRQIRVERTEDDLLKLDMKKQVQGGKLDPIDQALYERYTRRLMETKREEEKSLLMNKEK